MALASLTIAGAVPTDFARLAKGGIRARYGMRSSYDEWFPP